MKISIVLAEGAKQIMMTPETEHEKMALKMISTDDVLRVVSKWGTFQSEPVHAGYQVNMCQGGFLRMFEAKESLMFVIENKPKEEKAVTDVQP
jgi:hypothetical protein